MTEILLTPLIPSDAALERLNLFAGRHMGEDEFERQQAYTDRRLAKLLLGLSPGIVQGLEVKSSQLGVNAGFTVRAGLAVAANGQTLGLYYPLQETWKSLVDTYCLRTHSDNPAGVYYLTLERNSRFVDEDTSIHPEQRTEFDPTRDARRLVVGSLGLFRLGIDADVAATLTREQVENAVAANHVDTQFMAPMQLAVPLALVFIDDMNRGSANPLVYSARWFSPTCGQYPARAQGGYEVLLKQTHEAFQRLLNDAAAQSALSLPAYLEANLKLDYLPAAGQLPPLLLRNLASRDPANPPGVSWLPEHIAVDIVPVPEESVAALIARHLPRKVIDLRQANGDRVRLLLAVNEPDYTPDLLDVPALDGQLVQDGFRYFMRAYDIWAEWKRQFDKLYFLPEDAQVALDAAAIKALDLPQPIACPSFPQTVFTQLIARSKTELGTQGANQAYYPYDQGVPAAPAFYSKWHQQWLARETDPQDPRSFPDHVNPQAATGLLIQYTAALVDLDALDTRIRTHRSRLDRTRDFLLLQRQQLDSQTVSLAALAGGVAGDGSGLQVARWLPFTHMTASKINTADGKDDNSGTGTGTTSGAGTGSTTPSTTPSTTTSTTPVARAASKPLFMLASTNFINLKANTSIANTAQQLLTKKASSANNLVFSSALRKTPSIFAPLQFNLNNSRLDKIAEAPRQALTKPAFDTKEFRFGVLEHIRPEIQEYKKAQRGLSDLINSLKGMFDKAEAIDLQTKLQGFGVPLTYEQVLAEVRQEVRESLIEQGVVAAELNAATDKYLRENPSASGPKLYSALFSAGKILTQQIAWMEARYEQIESTLQGLLRARINKEDESEKLMALIRAGSEQLASIDKRRVEFLGDYGVVQRLLDDDWLDVFKRDQERTRILTKGVRGLYYLRVCQTPVGEALADPLLLRYSKAGDLVPGCDSDIDPDLPEDLDDFFETVLEVPMNDWVALQDFKMHVPAQDKLSYLDSLRRLRLQEKSARQVAATNASINNKSVPRNVFNAQVSSNRASAKSVNVNSADVKTSNAQQRRAGAATAKTITAKNAQAKTLLPSTVSISLFGLRQQTQSTLFQMAQLVLPVELVSSKNRQQQAAEVLSLADLLTTKGPLQKQAQTLHNHLEQAAWCMLEKLNELPPSIRLEWAQLAEDDRLRVEQVEYWPSLERAERDDFNSTRTLSEIVAWWFKQLTPDASAVAKSALRNLVRATLIHASLGDPAEILQGSVQVPPRRPIAGELMRLQLNRAPKPGTLLQLLDPQQRVVALLNVDDHDDKGTVARITQVTQTDIRITTQYRVVASKSTQQFSTR